MKERYRAIGFRAEALSLIDKADEILGEYTAQNLVVTVRQLYYQFVARGLLANTMKNYKRLAGIVSDARLAGLLDWDAIEDRGRMPDVPGEWESLDVLVRSAIRGFRLPRWHGQPNYVELWVEKQALAGVLEPVAREHHVTLVTNKGYSSQSAMRASAARIGRMVEETDASHVVVLYMGDFDPSGEDMVRDVRERLEMFGVALQVDKIALTERQIAKYAPPPNPAKSTDPRYGAYKEKHGDESWELDALDPATLQRVVRGKLADLIDPGAIKRVLAEESRQRRALEKALRVVAGGGGDAGPSGTKRGRPARRKGK